MQPRFSFATGGLAEAWTAGAYPWSEDDLGEFPFGHEDIEPYYRQVADRIGITGAQDDLERFLPWTADYLEPLELDAHSERLLSVYHRRRESLNRSLRFHLGRSRVAILSRDRQERKACSHLGRCLWGCPTDALYTPSLTIRECATHPEFTYCDGMFARFFDYDRAGRVTAVVAHALSTGREHRFEADIVVLAAGALCSSKIFLDSIFQKTGRVIELPGLMDNRQMHMPFLSPALIGGPISTASYQFHHLAFGLERERPEEYVHGQITTLKAASVHPIVQNLPVDLRTGLAVFRGIRAGLGIANINLHDARRTESYVTIHRTSSGPETELVVRYAPAPEDQTRRRLARREVKRALRRLGCIVPPGMTRVLPMGTSAHYAGTLPMTAEEVEYSCTSDCQVRGFPNLYVVDGTTFPFLPAKNLTFTLMANAVRVAERVLTAWSRSVS
jgi:choline dehydrogenase-like flavoprotein